MRISIIPSLPYLFAEPTALSWISLQENLLRAPNTVEAYARGLNNWLEFCANNNFSFLDINRQIIALYIRYLNSVHRVANSTLRHRIMIYAELSGDFPLGDSRQPIYKSLRPFDLVS
ncbi:site-specific integrase [Acinetobacter baumannii]|uniref:site-specific integrase n=2 Tax=Acinetobacter baumannii TaxID=470 RepID=UPI001E481787|nr:site-specific integrase [Acinetobacter baumannii]MDA3585731.1 site-specific integrase [Acinetobacter baumannii]